ncbi:MAG: tetraacyldisaccharide 4'-kinase, partial [Myxococcota bacterium]
VVLSTDPRDLGDEGTLLAGCGALVAAGPDRVRAARLLRDAGATVIVVDDGAARRGLHRDLELAIVDARFPGARGLLPAGERRERPVVRPTADLVLVHHGDGRFGFPGHPVVRRPTAWQPATPTGPVAAFAGIGRPADFLATIDLPVARFLAIPDHAPIDPQVLRDWAGGLPIVCTTKDAARLPPGIAAAWRDVDVVLPEVVLARLPAR